VLLIRLDVYEVLKKYNIVIYLLEKARAEGWCICKLK